MPPPRSSKSVLLARLVHTSRWVIFVCSLALLFIWGWRITMTKAAGSISLTILGAAVTENFDTLASSSTSSTVPTGWDFSEAGMNANTIYTAGTGSSQTGDTYSFGSSSSTERAFGGLQSGSLTPTIGASFTNNTGATITSLQISYTGEQWRLGELGRTDRLDFQYSMNATSLTTGTWTDANQLDFTAPTSTGTVGALDGNLAANRTAISSTITGLNITSGSTFWIRWNSFDATGFDDGLAIDNFSLTPNGATPVLSINDVTKTEGNSGMTTFSFTVSLDSPAHAGGVSFDIATANNSASAGSDYNGQTLSGRSIAAGDKTYTFDVTVNGDTTVEPDETFFVNITNVTGASVSDGQGQGTIVNDDISKIHDVQGNGAATPIPGATVIVEGIVTANFQLPNKLQGFFLQEEDADVDADPNTSEGIFIFCSSCPTPVAEGQRVKVTGSVSEFNNMTEITATTAPSVVVTEAGNHLAEVTPSPIDLPIAGDINAFYEAREGMKITFVDTLTVSGYSDLARYGQIELYEGGRPRQFTEGNPPSVAGNTAQQDNLARRRVILDDGDNTQNAYLSSPDGSQAVFYPQANGGFSVGTQGVDFFRGGDLVNGLTGVLHWSFPGFGAETWRIRPTAANPVAFTVANPRPASPPAVGGAIKVASLNLLNYFTTIDTTSSNNTGTCGPSGSQDCRGADSVAELNRQRERASIAVCTMNADIYGFMELENTTPSNTITDLLGAINARCGGAHPYTFVNTGGTLGTDAIRVQLIYRTGIVSPVGSPLVDLDPVHNRPPTAQTFDVVDATNPAFGQRFTVIANHFKSKNCDASATSADADTGDGQGCYNGQRTAQATRLLTWINGTVLPAAGDPDVLLLGDFNSYAKEDPVTVLTAGGFTDVESALLGTNAYSYVFDAQLGHLDYAFASSSLFPKVTGVGAWHINADEVDLFDYNDEVKDTGEATFEEKPDGSALVPPRVVFQPASPYRASDHDPILVGLFPVADLRITKTDSITTATPGGSVMYTITASNDGPNNDTGATVTDTFPQTLTCTWSCMGAGGGACTGSGSGNINDTVNLPSGGSVTYTATCTISAAATGTLSNTATVTNGETSDSNTANNSAKDEDMLTPQTDLAITKTDNSTTYTPGNPISYTIVVNNNGPSNATGAGVADAIPAAITGTQISCVASGTASCGTNASVGNTLSFTGISIDAGASNFLIITVSGTVSPAATGNLVNMATVTEGVNQTDSKPENNKATDTDTRAAKADLSITKTDGVTSAQPGGSVTYKIVASNAGPSNVTAATVVDNFPTACSTVSWTCAGAGGGTCGAMGSGNINDSVNLPNGGSVTYTATCTIAANATDTLKNTATVTSPKDVTELMPNNNTAEDTDSLIAQPALKVAIGDPLICLAPGGLVGVTATVTNPNGFAVNANFTATLPTTLNGLPGTGLASINQAGLTVTTSSVTWNGMLPANQTLIINYKAQIVAGTPANTPICIDSEATFNGGPAAKVQECKVLGCPAGPVNVAVSDQKVGSLLAFPYYTSKATTQSDTRLSISNIGDKVATVHLFFVDGATCQQSDSFLCLTPNASFAFKASEYDAETTGWLLAVAVDAQGRPVQYNGLIGNAFVKDGEYVDNYGAESFRANSSLVATINGNTATLFFDNQSYDAVPNQFAVEVQSPVDTVGQRVITVGLSGDLTTSQLSGAAQVGTGLVFNGNEKPFGSFSAWLTGSCQASALLSTTSPRVPNGMSGMIPSGQVGTIKLNIGAGVGLLMTPRTATWKGIRTLHKTGLTTTTIIIPIGTPVC